MAANEKNPDTSQGNLPGVSPGATAAQPVASGQPPVVAPGQSSVVVPVAKPPFGGNAGKKKREDGLKPGSPEAIAADKDADAKRKRDARAAVRAATPPPPLPASSAPLSESLPDQTSASLSPDAGPVVDPVVSWTPTDFRDCAPQLVELAEAWRVDVRTKQATAGKLPAKVVQKIAADAAFPPGSRKALSESSPVTLASK